MARHPIDHARATDDGLRAGHFAEIERRSGDAMKHPGIETLARRPRPQDGDRRTQEFVRIARGRTA